MKKPDRFARVVDQAYRDYLSTDTLIRPLMAGIMRRQHASLQRLIRLKMSCDVPSNRYVYKDLLAAMYAWKKGQP